jgi:hypothetical protein
MREQELVVVIYAIEVVAVASENASSTGPHRSQQRKTQR